MRVAQTILSLALVIGMNPGLLEVFQDGLHLLADGRTDHAEDTEACSEHGCAPTGHHCDCCTTMQMVSPMEVASVLGTSATPHRWMPPTPEAAPRGIRRRVPRPPSA